MPEKIYHCMQPALPCGNIIALFYGVIDSKIPVSPSGPITNISITVLITVCLKKDYIANYLHDRIAHC